MAKKSLKIERKKKKKVKKTTKKRLTVKITKLDRTMRKAKAFVKKAIKTAIKGSKLKRVPERLYRKVDAEIAKSAELKSIVEVAVVSVVNTVLAEKKEKVISQ
jgi:hypothetical protein